jgi:hypothetical protein
MERSREQLLAGAALSFEQDGGVRVRRALQRREDFAEREILTDDLRGAAPDGELLLEQQVLRHDAALLERARHQQRQMIGIDGLGEEVHRPFLHGADRVLDAPVGGHDDDGDVGVDVLRGAQHAEAVAFGQAQIGQDDRRLRLVQQPNGLGLIAGFEDGVLLALQRMPEHRPQRVLVLDDEDLARQRIQPAGTLARRASSSMSVIVFFAASISLFTAASSARAFWRSSAISARWYGSSRAVKSAVRPLMRD